MDNLAVFIYRLSQNYCYDTLFRQSDPGILPLGHSDVCREGYLDTCSHTNNRYLVPNSNGYISDNYTFILAE